MPPDRRKVKARMPVHACEGGCEDVVEILGTRLCGGSKDNVVAQIETWSANRAGRVVAAANVHMLMEAADDPQFRELLNSADMAIADGRPLTWASRLLCGKQIPHIRGMDLTLSVLSAAAKRGTPVAFFGGRPEVLEKLRSDVLARWPDLAVRLCISPPYPSWPSDADDEFCAMLNASGARIVFVGLGCPKQERWMLTSGGNVAAVKIGIGAVFDFLAGAKSVAPPWVSYIGCEWLFRLATEPRRLWWRYVSYNPRFVWLVLQQWIRRPLRSTRKS